MCFYERKHRFILTGDHVLPSITPNVSLHPQQMGNPLGDYLASLRRLESLDVDKVLPAHEYEFKDLRGRVNEIVEHHDMRLDEMRAIVGADGATAYDVASGIVWTTGTYDSFSFWMRRAAISEPDGSIVFEMNDVEVPESWSQLANSTMRPRYITATRSDIWRTTLRSCAINIYVNPRSRCKSCNKLMICA